MSHNPAVLSNISFSDGDLVKTITFKSTQDCDGEVVIGELYNIGSTTLVATITSGSDLGNNKGKEISVSLDATGVAEDLYGLKIYTAETGVIAKGIILVK